MRYTVMKLTSELIGKPIVSGDRGEKIGAVEDVLIDTDRGSAVAFVVGGGFLKSDHLLPYAEVQVLGTDVLIARSASGVVDAAVWKQRNQAARRVSHLKNLRVITHSGRDVGGLSDVYLDDAGGVAAYDVTQREFANIVRRHTQLARSSEIVVGQDALVVPDSVADALEHSTK